MIGVDSYHLGHILVIVMYYMFLQEYHPENAYNLAPIMKTHIKWMP
jgi:hypothetical protein